MCQPQGFIHPDFPTHICSLKKSLYGLCQAPRSWFSRLTEQLTAYGFVGSKSDNSLYIMHSAKFQLLILIYVDDIIVTGSHFEEITKLITYLGRAFPVKDLGPLSYFLGVETLQEGGNLILTQRKSVIDLLRKANLDKVKPCSTPMSTSCKLSKYEGVDFDDPHLYRSTVGALHYLGFTRPDIAFAVHKVSKFMHQPKDVHWQAVKRILRYLKHTVNYGLHLTSQASHTLQAFSDADWAGDNDDKWSVRAYCIFHGDNLISWSCKQQQTVARSSTESEYKSLANTAAELQWLQSLLKELQMPLQCCPTLWCDNIGATYLSSNPVFHARTKHIEIDFHFVRDKFLQQNLQVSFLSTSDQLADLLTKPLAAARFNTLRSNLHVQELPIRLRGHIKSGSADHVTAQEEYSAASKPQAKSLKSGFTDHVTDQDEYSAATKSQAKSQFAEKT
ncbi:hypothetical protein F2P56_015896 [Juglans regia]|uniref:Reverse transcriptase Ty1/copia-type domain-containing protein n=1 Tax=Juglans regia TaxID=51240 RepID=A0A833XGK5_JUGRE|nr:hypothetical protein F2P56_015896 [Juglans regia]